MKDVVIKKQYMEGLARVIILSLTVAAIFVAGYYYRMDTHPDSLEWIDRTGSDTNQVPNFIKSENVLWNPQSGSICINKSYNMMKFTDTNSMLPIVDYGSIGLVETVTPDTELRIGMIVTYEPVKDTFRMHRIVDIKQDEEGYYYVMKGDNVPAPDDYLVRKSQIKYVLEGVLW